MLMLAVAGTTMSCEKDFTNDGGNDFGNVENPAQGDENAVEADKFVGCWICHEALESNKVLTLTYRFYEEGKGYKTSDEYINGKVGGFGRTPMTYWVDNNALYILNAHDEKPIEWLYQFDNNTLTLTNIELNIKHIFFKEENESKKFMGSWERIEKVDDYYYRYVITMTTPTDGYTMYWKYNNPNGRAIYQSADNWFKYSFDDIKLVMTEIGPDVAGREATRYYRMSGADLFLSKTYQGEANCYEDFYRANGIEFQP